MTDLRPGSVGGGTSGHVRKRAALQMRCPNCGGELAARPRRK
ncbi:MAG: DUF1272 domain-containing protein [Candidatus Eremiobacteraeota bacterium]|nr:DUF1272 domain-containing protein [Candidatus Eremiobacteraeota bacterium]